MPLISSTPMLKRARSEGYCIGAFNVHTLEMLQAVVEAAEEAQAPLILQTTVGTVKHLGPAYVAAMARVEAELGKVGGVELAPANGTAHGMYKGEPRIDFGRLEKTRKEKPLRKSRLGIDFFEIMLWIHMAAALQTGYGSDCSGQKRSRDAALQYFWL